MPAENERIEDKILRYERKFATEEISYQEVLLFVRKSKFLFSREFPDRHINNVYFDTPDRRLYLDSVEGACQRKKFRFRWYGPLASFSEKPVLEVKNKHAALGWKDSYELPRHSLAEVLGSFPGQLTLDPSVSQSLKICKPSLCNRYLRTYFRSANGKFRLTVDRDIEFFKLTKDCEFSSRVKLASFFVVELKYGNDCADIAPEVAASIPLRMTRNSKYTIGIDLLS